MALVAKADSRHVERALRTTGAENLAMIHDTVSHLVREGRRVFVDGEHFFDGYRHDPAYGVAVVQTALAMRRRADGALRHQRRHAAVPGDRRDR